MTATTPAPPPVPLKDWGANVRTARRSLRMTQAELGQTIGVTQQTISKMENGEIDTSSEKKLALATLFQIGPHLLFPWPLIPFIPVGEPT